MNLRGVAPFVLRIPICYTKGPFSLYPECGEEAIKQLPSDLLVRIQLWLLSISLVVLWSLSRKLKVVAQLLNQKSQLIVTLGFPLLGIEL